MEGIAPNVSQTGCLNFGRGSPLQVPMGGTSGVHNSHARPSRLTSSCTACQSVDSRQWIGLNRKFGLIGRPPGLLIFSTSLVRAGTTPRATPVSGEDGSMIVHAILIQGRVPGLGAVECPSSVRRALPGGCSTRVGVVGSSVRRQLGSPVARVAHDIDIIVSSPGDSSHPLGWVLGGRDAMSRVYTLHQFRIRRRRNTSNLCDTESICVCSRSSCAASPTTLGEMLGTSFCRFVSRPESP